LSIVDQPVMSAPGEIFVEDAAEPKRRHLLAAVWRGWRGRAGCILVGIVVVASVVGLFVSAPSNVAPPLQAPSSAHLLGTNLTGQDVLDAVLQGLGVSLEIAVLAVLIAGVAGTLGGVLAGFVGGWTETVIMRFTDILLAVPAILLALSLVAALGNGVVQSAVAIGVGYAAIFVRVVRGPVLTQRRSDYVRAGRVLGFSRRRLLFGHVLPNVSGVIVVQTTLALAWAILAEASLEFLGVGPPPPPATLGEMVQSYVSNLGLSGQYIWILAGPAVAIVIAVTGFNLLGDGLRDALDPRTRSR
jgi:peptide/nickel transport system permease protein